MICRRTVLAVLAVLALAAGRTPCVGGGEAREPSEEEKRLKILAAYHSGSPEERREAVRALTRPEYRGNREVGKLLYEVAWSNPDPEARLAAFQALCTWPDADGSLAYHLARLFKHELEATNKPGMAFALTRLEFKTDALNELIFYIRLLGGTDDAGWGSGYDTRVGAGGSGTGGGTTGGAKSNTAWDRAHYKAILDAINRISRKQFVASYDTGRQLLNWWRLNAVDFQRADYELARKQKGQVEGQGAAVSFEPARKAEPASPGAAAKAAEAKPQPKPAAVDEDTME
jgi:hypothetical protein